MDGTIKGKEKYDLIWSHFRFLCVRFFPYLLLSLFVTCSE